MNLHLPEKPKLRGHFHQSAFFIALGAGAMLIGRTPSATHLVSTWIYVCSLCLMYGISALYHRPNWMPKTRVWFRKLDHAAIYLFIAGTTTPLATRTLSGDSQHSLLILMWSSAILGCLQSLFWIRAPKFLCSVFYLIMGWLAWPYLSEIRHAIGATGMELLVAGGIAYTAGALIYAIKKPNPLPLSFGYHEIFHLLVVGGSFCHFILIQKIILEV